VYRKKIRFLRERATERERITQRRARALSFAEEEADKGEARGRQEEGKIFNTEDAEKAFEKGN
jgi:hypothetical protein